jgi:hypothetical protein
MTIYWRSGEPVFTSENYNTAWDGSFGVVALNASIYFCLIQVKIQETRHYRGIIQRRSQLNPLKSKYSNVIVNLFISISFFIKKLPLQPSSILWILNYRPKTPIAKLDQAKSPLLMV